jgi:hypothetical protein
MTFLTVLWLQTVDSGRSQGGPGMRQTGGSRFAGAGPSIKSVSHAFGGEGRWAEGKDMCQAWRCWWWVRSCLFSSSWRVQGRRECAAAAVPLCHHARGAPRVGGAHRHRRLEGDGEWCSPPGWNAKTLGNTNSNRRAARVRLESFRSLHFAS